MNSRCSDEMPQDDWTKLCVGVLMKEGEIAAKNEEERERKGEEEGWAVQKKDVQHAPLQTGEVCQQLKKNDQRCPLNSQHWR